MYLGQGGLSPGLRRGGFSAGGQPASAPAPIGTFTGAFGKRGYSAAPKPTVHPVMASTPGMYGGPPGSFITQGSCPPGYMRSAMPRGPSQPQTYRCIPRVAAPAAPKPAPAPPPAPPVTVSPTITVSPVMQQAFDPQFSPVLQMAQDSPGMTQAAAPTQTAAPAQAAKTEAPAPPPAAPPSVSPRAAPPSLPPPGPMAPSMPPAGPAFEPLPSIPEAVPVAAPMPMPMPAPSARADLAPPPAEPPKGFNMGLLAIYAAAAVGLFLFTRKPQKGKAK